jgi:hypothetical protein
MIILNWHWACADPPPQLDVAGATICVACNIAISVRVGSPGDTGDLAQTIAAQTQATAATVAHTIQSALQSAPEVARPVPPTPPVVFPPGLAPPVTVATALSQPQLYPIDLGPFVAPLDAAATDDPPLHGAPSTYGAALAPAAQLPESQGVAGEVVSLAALRASSTLSSPPRSIVGRAGAGSRSPVGTRRPAHRPVPPAIPPSAPMPFVLAAGSPSTHGGGPSAVVALATAVALAFLYAVYSALRTRPAVPPARGGGAKPHPPG